ncbi:MAG TPA: hypothetical protein PLV57_22430 [Phycisphaerae bacterium]|nr:hypothetical protein [Phycisphaerae bacterium]HPP29270.1 hypothetical protein [Phycisphaerae bacterium]
MQIRVTQRGDLTHLVGRIVEAGEIIEVDEATGRDLLKHRGFEAAVQSEKSEVRSERRTTG